MNLPGPGETFTTATGVTIPPPSSRRESSWYFGDGAVLFNQAAAALAQLPGRITTLDPVLGRSLGEREDGWSIGVSVSRVLSPRLGVEMIVDYPLGRLRITGANRDAIEATRASFIPAFSGLIAFNPNRVLNSVTSTAALERGDGRQLVTSGSLIINLKTTGDVIPYAIVGAGLISTTGKRPSATLQDDHQFLLPGDAPISETDRVTVTDARVDRTFAGILGGG